MALDILIFSDSHGNDIMMQKVLASHESVSHVLFCGDGIRDSERMATLFPKKVFLDVRGNCDALSFSFDTPIERLLPWENHKILLLHGHTVGVKGGYGFAAAYAAKAGADILIFGHTHEPHDARLTVGDKSVHLFNPGSIGRLHHGVFSYGILTVRENGYLFSHGTVL